MLVSPGAGFGSRQDKGWASVFPMELICSLPRSEPIAKAMGRPGGGGDPDTGLAHLGALCPLPFGCPLGRGLSSPVLPSRRLYLSLVLGNVNVTLLSKQAK